MNLQQLEYIIAVNHYRHFAKAAEHCNVTQPTLSMMIQRLEEELGVKLFDRSRQPVQPTLVGEKVLEQAKIVVRQASLIKEIVNEEINSFLSVFRVAVLPTIAPYLLPRFFQQLVEKNEELNLQIKEMKTNEIIAALKAGEIEAAIMASHPTDKELQSSTLFYEEFFVYVAENEPIFKKERVKTTDLNGERLWLLDEGHCFREQLMRFCQMEKVKVFQKAYQLGSIETFMRMVESNNGLTFIPELAIAQMCLFQQKFVRPFAIPKPAREITIVTRKDFVRQNTLDLFTESILKAISPEMHKLKVDQKIV